METTKSTVTQSSATTDCLGKSDAHCCGVSWKAVIAGAVVAAAVALILISLGMGLGFSIVSPWANKGVSATAIGVGTVVWLIVTQIVAPSVGGYLTGRLRSKWTDVHTDEMFFRDTAHGFLVWAVSLILSVSLLASATTSLIGGSVRMGATMASTVGTSGPLPAPSGKRDEQPNAYLIDSLFRSPQTTTDINPSKAEIGHILANGLKQQELPAADKIYIRDLVAAKLGISQAEAEKRVTEFVNQAQQAKVEAQQMADAARKTAAHLSLWGFIALLMGAFCASYAATIGGRQRDCKRACAIV